ncbi:hypothetical protein R1sor_006102 [Riccia sorocarpa]|uniref:Chlorophyllase n=1 Tax=Riccia sorocarpa TaxID=122646 RepID=A0ABD3HNR5_9MARC
MNVRLSGPWTLLATLLTIMVACTRAVHHQTDTDAVRLAPDIYNEGPLKADLFTVYSAALKGHRHHRMTLSKFRCSELKLPQDPPRPLLIAAPTSPGEYPVVLFQHGFTMRNTYYSQLLNHIASHGFIVVAPQMYLWAGSDATAEIATAASVVDWFSVGLRDALCQRVPAVEPDLKRIAVMGHSRGGKVVFGLVTGVSNTSLKISAVVGLDPVDGTGVGHQTIPAILKNSPHSLNLKIPTLITGAGLGSDGRFLFPACAPKGVSHDNFYSDSSAPAVHFVAPEHGHMDYMDDDCPGVQGWMSFCLCTNGPSREPMRKFSAGVVVAFLQASLLQDSTQLSKALSNPSAAPLKLDTPELYGSVVDITNSFKASV